MKRISALIFLIACACQAAPIAKIYRWDSRVEDGPAMALEPTRGETMVLQPRLLSYGSPMDLSSAVSVILLYKASGSTNVYSVTGGVYLATNGQAQIIWTSSNELAASTYSFDVLVSSLTTTVVGARGTIKFREGPAYGAQYSTNTPIRVLDFASASLLNIDLAPFLRTSDLTGLVAGVTSITNTSDILSSGDGTGAQGLSLSPARLASLARADLALTNSAAFDPAGSAAAAAAASVPTSRTFTVNGTTWNMDSNGSVTIASGGNVASVTGAGGLTNTAGTTGAVTIALSAGSVASLARADAALTNAATFATAAQGTSADTAFGWGDHSTNGYVTQAVTNGLAPTAALAEYVPTNDPRYLASLTNAAEFATAAQGGNADTAFGWGDHGTNGYLAAETDPLAVKTNDPAYLGAFTGAVFAAQAVITIADRVLNIGTNNFGSGTGGGSQTPATSNWDMAGYSLTNAGAVVVTGRVTGAQLWLGTNTYLMWNGTGIVQVIP
jgi:hypothetical protein